MTPVTHLDHLRTHKALLHTRTLLHGAGLEELGAFMVSVYKLAQAECRYSEANQILAAAAALYSPDAPSFEDCECRYCGIPIRVSFGAEQLCSVCRNPSDGGERYG